MLNKNIYTNGDLHVYTNPGIGDALWALFYLFPNNSRKIKIHTIPRKNFTSAFLKDIKNVISVDEDLSEAHPNVIDYFSLAGFSEHARQFEYYNLNTFDEYPGNKVYLSCNQYIDFGRRLETYLPKMKIDFKIPWNFEINKTKNLKNKYIVIITSAEDQNDPVISPDVSPKWSPYKWNEIVHQIKVHNPDLKIFWCGNKNNYTIFNKALDIRLFDRICLDFDSKQILDLLYGSVGHVGYQCGISHIAVYENIPTYFLTFPRLDKISYAWTQPGIENNKLLYNPVFFDKFDLKDLLNWVNEIKA